MANRGAMTLPPILPHPPVNLPATPLAQKIFLDPTNDRKGPISKWVHLLGFIILHLDTLLLYNYKLIGKM